MAEEHVASSPFASLQAHHAKHHADLVRSDQQLAYLEFNSFSPQALLGSLLNNLLIAEQLDSRYELQKQLRFEEWVSTG